MTEGPVTTYGYSGEVVLPVDRDLGARRDAVSGEVTAHWLVCKDICVPGGSDVPDRPAGRDHASPSAQMPLFTAHDQAVPRASPWEATIAADGTLFVRGRELRPATVIEAWFIPDTSGPDRR